MYTINTSVHVHVHCTSSNVWSNHVQYMYMYTINTGIYSVHVYTCTLYMCTCTCTSSNVWSNHVISDMGQTF